MNRTGDAAVGLDALREVHVLVRRLLEEFDRVSSAAGTTYFLAYGTALGAVRDGDLIGWDVDADLWLPHTELDRLLTAAVPLLGDDYELLTAETHDDYEYLFPRLVFRGVHHVYLRVDIFPLDPAPRRRLGRLAYLVAMRALAKTLFVQRAQVELRRHYSPRKRLLLQALRALARPVPSKVVIALFRQLQALGSARSRTLVNSLWLLRQARVLRGGLVRRQRAGGPGGSAAPRAVGPQPAPDPALRRLPDTTAAGDLPPGAQAGHRPRGAAAPRARDDRAAPDPRARAMTTLVPRAPVTRQAPRTHRTTTPTPRWLTAGGFVVIGAAMILAAQLLQGSSRVAPGGLLAGGVALVVAAPWARGSLDALVVLNPFAFYALAPAVGLLTVSSSDVFLPVAAASLLVGLLYAPRRNGTSTDTRTGQWLLLLSAVVLLGSVCVWTVASPDFLLAQAVSDIVKLGIGVGYFVVVLNLCLRQGAAAVQHALVMWTWVATALSIGSLVGITGAVQVVPSDGYRSLGFFEDPNLYAGYLLVSLAVVFYVTATELSPGLWLVQAFAIVGGVVTTGSRAGLGSLVVLVILAVVVVRSARLRAALVATAALVTAAGLWLLSLASSGVAVLGIDRLSTASQDVPDDPRLSLWSLAIDKWLDHPVLGIGPGQFQRYSGESYRTLDSGLGYVTHNTFLFFLVGNGVLGLMLFLAFLAWMVRTLFRSPVTSNARYALFTGVAVLLVEMLTLNLQNLRYVWIYFALVVGLAITSTRAEQESRK